MTPAEIATARIKPNEGLRLQVYDDATGAPIVRGTTVRGNPTIGYGRLACMPHGISTGEAEILLANDVETAAEQAATLDPWPTLDPVRQSVLIEMVFQMGVGGVRAFVNTLAAMTRGDYADAAAGMRASAWARQTPHRANALADLMENGQ